ncbi:hypothetical protein [Salinibacterium sp.]|uniref:hypothetical protein n=1 Tax=Salinibacterium sp. TaxID=1915057 RepID=UPI00286D5B1E|nr:hypothetical protein [Salinibacterium sp.]
MAVGTAGSLSVTCGPNEPVTIGVTTFHTEGEPTVELIVIEVPHATFMGLTKAEGIDLARMILDATDLLDQPVSPRVVIT